MAVGSDGTTYVSGLALSAPNALHPAYATLRPGSAPAMAACFSQTGGDDGTSIRALAPARTVLYASVWESDHWGIVRLQ
jgi:hypothetical protein